MGWLRQIWDAVAATFVLDYCPWGEWPSATCRGCFLDRQWAGSLAEDHAPGSLTQSAEAARDA